MFNYRQLAAGSSLLLSAFEMMSDVADPAGNHYQQDTNDANDDGERAHRSKIAIDVEMIEKRPQRLRSG